MLPDLIGEVTHDSQTKQEAMAPRGLASKRTFLKQWEPKLASCKLIVQPSELRCGRQTP